LALASGLSPRLLAWVLVVPSSLTASGNPEGGLRSQPEQWSIAAAMAMEQPSLACESQEKAFAEHVAISLEEHITGLL